MTVETTQPLKFNSIYLHFIVDCASQISFVEVSKTPFERRRHNIFNQVEMETTNWPIFTTNERPNGVSTVSTKSDMNHE